MLTMAQSVDSKAYYGKLFQADKKPTILLDALLRGIANYIIESIGDKEEKCLIPSKLAAFYKSVGGNYDSLFVDVPYPSISWIYASIGCQHTLQPSIDDFTPPNIPALTPQGFVRWQSIEILLGPEEHVPFLQNAVRNFVIKHPDTGERFPIVLPAEALPTTPDEDIEKWHASCGEKLRQRATPNEENDIPHMPAIPKVQGYSHVRASRPRVETDYFEPKSRTRPIPFQHVSSADARPVRPRLSRSPTTRARQFLAPEDNEPPLRSRRRSYPENMSSPEIVSPPHASYSQADLHPPHPHDHPRRHSHTHHGHRYSVSSDASSEADSQTPSPTHIVEVEEEEEPPRRQRPHSHSHSHSERDHSSQHHSHSDREHPKARYNGSPTTASRPRSPDPRIRNRDRDRDRDRDNEPKRRSFPNPFDLPAKLSAQFLGGGKKNRDRVDSDSARGSRSNSHSRNANNVRWKDLYDADPEWRRTPRVSDEDISVQAPLPRREERRDERRKDRERERERDRERELKPRTRSRRSSHEDPGRRGEREREVHERRGGSSFHDRDEGPARRGGGFRDRRPPSPAGVRVVDGTHSRRGVSPVRGPDGSIRGVDGRRYPSGRGHAT